MNNDYCYCYFWYYFFVIVLVTICGLLGFIFSRDIYSIHEQFLVIVPSSKYNWFPTFVY
jgi:hypothetical protein